MHFIVLYTLIDCRGSRSEGRQEKEKKQTNKQNKIHRGHSGARAGASHPCILFFVVHQSLALSLYAAPLDLSDNVIVVRLAARRGRKHQVEIIDHRVSRRAGDERRSVHQRQTDHSLCYVCVVQRAWRREDGRLAAGGVAARIKRKRITENTVGIQEQHQQRKQYNR